MAQIGTFTRGEDGSYTGTIKTLSLNIKGRFVPTLAEREGAGSAPAGIVAIGAAWKRGLEGGHDPPSRHRSTPTWSRWKQATHWSGHVDPDPQGRGAVSAAPLRAWNYARPAFTRYHFT
jgi:uncharacterized protein (DUF736 family)